MIALCSTEDERCHDWIQLFIFMILGKQKLIKHHPRFGTGCTVFMLIQPYNLTRSKKITCVALGLHSFQK